MLEKQGNYIVVTSLRCPHGRCSDRVASLDINIGACFNQEFAKCVVVVDSCPLDHTISVLIRRNNSWRAHTCNGVMPSSSRNLAPNFPPLNRCLIGEISPNLASCMISSCSGSLSSTGPIFSSSISAFAVTFGGATEAFVLVVKDFRIETAVAPVAFSGGSGPGAIYSFAGPERFSS